MKARADKAATHRPKTTTAGLDKLVGEFVEARTLAGGAFRGYVRAVGIDWLRLELHTGGTALVRQSACSAIVLDDAAARRSRREAEAGTGEGS